MDKKYLFDILFVAAICLLSLVYFISVDSVAEDDKQKKVSLEFGEYSAPGEMLVDKEHEIVKINRSCESVGTIYALKEGDKNMICWHTENMDDDSVEVLGGETGNRLIMVNNSGIVED